ncbi:MAG: EAL domain-containing protein [Pseudomonadota bacterium]
MTIGYYAIDKRELQHGLEDRQFALSLQPIINIENESFETLEVFIRWRHPLLGMLPPSLFMPMMAKEGLGAMMTDYIVHEAVNICNLSKRSGKTIGVNININSNELHNEETLSSIDGATYDMDDPESVCLELSPQILTQFSETAGVTQYLPDQKPTPEESKYLETLKYTLEKYADLGITLALDTYDHIWGAIDRAEILGLHAVKVSPKLIAACAMGESEYLQKCSEKAQKANIALIGTGVENLSHMKAVITSHINYVQGMFMCPPVYQQQLSNWNIDNLIEAKRITHMLSDSAANLKMAQKKMEASYENNSLATSKPETADPINATHNISSPPEPIQAEPPIETETIQHEQAPSRVSPQPAPAPKKQLGFSTGKPGLKVAGKGSFGKKTL